MTRLWPVAAARQQHEQVVWSTRQPSLAHLYTEGSRVLLCPEDGNTVLFEITPWGDGKLWEKPARNPPHTEVSNVMPLRSRYCGIVVTKKGC